MKKFKFLLLLFAAEIVCTASAAAEFSSVADVKVGSQPDETFYYQGFFHVFCMGYDANTNRIFDEGDEYPSLWKISEAHPEISPEKILEFPMDDIKTGTDYSFDKNSGIVYKSYHDTLQAINLNTGTIEDNYLQNIRFDHFAIDGEDKIEILYHQILCRSYFVRSLISSNEGILVDSLERFCYSIRPFTTNTYVGFAALGTTFKSGLQYDSVEAYIYKYGVLDKSLSSLSIDTIYVGTNGSAIEIENNRIYVLESMSNILFKIDIDSGKKLETQKIEAPEDYGTHLLSVKDGQAALIVRDEDYSKLRNSKLQVFDLSNYNHRQEFELDGIAEHVIFSNNSIAVSLFKMPGEGQKPESKVSIFKESTSVSDKEIDDIFQISPNPVTDDLSLDISNTNLNIKSIEIYSADARLVQTIKIHDEILSNSKISINCSGLNSGIYYAVLKTDNISFSKQFVVAK